MITKFKLFESPDNLIFNGKRYSSHSEDSVSFCVLAKPFDDTYYTVYVDNIKGQGHPDMEYTPIPGESEPRFTSFYFNTFYGRLWLNEKLISFWDIPKIDEDVDINAFRYYMNELKRKLVKRGFISENENLENWNMQIENNKFIKVKNFIGDFKKDEDNYRYHLMRSDDIRRKNRPKKYFGNIDDSKPLKWKQALLRSENVNEFKYNIGDYVEVQFSGYDTLLDKNDFWTYIIHINWHDEYNNIYYGKEINNGWIENFRIDDIIRKVPKSEVDLILNTKKYNI